MAGRYRWCNFDFPPTTTPTSQRHHVLVSPYVSPRHHPYAMPLPVPSNTLMRGEGSIIPGPHHGVTEPPRRWVPPLFSRAHGGWRRRSLATSSICNTPKHLLIGTAPTRQLPTTTTPLPLPSTRPVSPPSISRVTTPASRCLRGYQGPVPIDRRNER